VQLQSIGDCGSCEVTASQPRSDNIIILEIYENVPKSFSELSGIPNISAVDIVEVIKIMNLARSKWKDYYNRVVFFHEKLVEYRLQQERVKEEKGK